jgi:hypothetical protein
MLNLCLMKHGRLPATRETKGPTRPNQEGGGAEHVTVVNRYAVHDRRIRLVTMDSRFQGVGRTLTWYSS